ncbi:hypothetical protein FQR65_LT00574 [Abscondita terminalis]|nr:hypothetical protein FQR65_LT00574 [Abscondita terminalis]
MGLILTAYRLRHVTYGVKKCPVIGEDTNDVQRKALGGKAFIIIPVGVRDEVSVHFIRDMMRYSLIILPCLLAYTYGISQDYQSKALAVIAEIADKCVDSTGANEDDIAELMDKKPPSRKQGKCLMACFYKEMGAMKNGKVDKDGTMEMLEPLKADDPDAYSKVISVMNKVFDEMAAEDEKDECEYAVKLADCIMKVAKEVSEQFLKDLKYKLADIAGTCIPEVGATNADIAELISKKTPSTKEGKCLVSCFQKKFGLQDENGRPNREGTMAFLEPLHDDDPQMYTKVFQIAIICGPEVEKMPITDHCEVAIAITSCAMREGQKFGLEDPFTLSG